MEEKLFSFEKLAVYNMARELVKEVYSVIKFFPKEENYALGDQLRRAVVSVPSNIAEGMSRLSTKEQLHFLEISYGSLMEVLCQVGIAKDLSYLSEDAYCSLHLQIKNVSKALLALHYSIKKTVS